MAIAFDASYASGTISGTGDVTRSFTCSGNNRILFVLTAGNTDQMTAVTYAGDSLTQIGNTIDTGTSVYLRLWYLVNPDSGANDIVATWGGNGAHGIVACSYNGVRQSNPTITASGTASGTDPVITTITTVSDNSHAVLIAGAGVDLTASTNTLAVGVAIANAAEMFRSDGAITPAGDYSMTVTGGNSSKYSLAVAFSPMLSASLTDTITTTEGTFSAIKRFIRDRKSVV